MRVRRWIAIVFGLAWVVAAHAAKPAVDAPPDALARAESLLDAAQMTSDPNERFRLADEAAALCRSAAKERPRDPEPVLKLVRAITIGDPLHPEACRPGRCEAALELLQKLARADERSLHAARIWSEQGIILSRMQRFEEALAAYERAMPLVDAQRRPNVLDERPGTVLLWGNSAETAMALGRLDEAIRRFEVALDRAVYGETEWQLALYGLAVALDRDGQVERARRTMERVLERDPSLQRTRDEGVFFEPPGDVSYYEGLAHEVAGDEARARRAFEAFLTAQPSSPHAARARAHLAGLRGSGDVVAPLVEVGMPVSIRGMRSRPSIAARIRAHQRELTICYERHLRLVPRQAVSMQVALEIAPSGYVGGRVQVLSTSEPAVALSRCVELSAAGWRFEPLETREPDGVLVPVSFQPNQPGSH